MTDRRHAVLAVVLVFAVSLAGGHTYAAFTDEERVSVTVDASELGERDGVNRQVTRQSTGNAGGGQIGPSSVDNGDDRLVGPPPAGGEGAAEGDGTPAPNDTETPTQNDTATPTPTATPTATATPTPTPTPTATPTPTPTATPTPNPTATPTATPEPPSTATRTPETEVSGGE